MIIEYVRYRIDSGRHQNFLVAYEHARRYLDDSEYCLRYELSQCFEDPDYFILRIEWNSLEGHNHGFRKSSEFEVFLEHVMPFFDDIEEMRHYTLTGVRSPKQV